MSTKVYETPLYRAPICLVARARLHAHEDQAFGALPKFAKLPTFTSMSTMNISLPESLKSFVDEQVTTRGFGTSSEYIRELIRKDLDRQRLRGLLLQGAQSAAAAPAGAGYFEGLRNQIRSRRTR